MSILTDEDLIFQPLEDTLLLKTPIFSLIQRTSRKPDGGTGKFVLVDSPCWANVVTIVQNEQRQDCFLMVRQYRHGDGHVYWEFPGGMVDAGETAKEAAERELREETGHSARQFILLGECNPNPAFMTNRVSTFLAIGAERVGDLSLDLNEKLRVGLLPVSEVKEKMAQGDFGHGIMVLALFWWERYCQNL